MNVLKQMVVILLCASAACTVFAAEFRLDNDTRFKIDIKTVDSDIAGKIFNVVLMPVPGVQKNEVVGHISLNAYDNPFDDNTTSPPRLIHNPMLELGSNVKHGSARIKGKPALWQGMETTYQTSSLDPQAGSRAYSEWYVTAVQSDGVGSRPFTAYWDADNHTKNTAFGMKVSRNKGFFINSVDDESKLFSFLGTGEAQIPYLYVIDTLLVKGTTAFGLTDRAQFSPQGQLTLMGAARVRKSLIIPLSRISRDVSSPPVLQRAVGSSGSIKAPVLSFSKTAEQSVYIEIRVPLDTDDSVGVELRALWQPAAGWSSGNCVWKFEHLIKNETGNIATGTPVTISSDTLPVNAADMQMSIFSTLLDANKRQVILGRFYRDVASDNGNAAAELRYLEIEYTANKLGEEY